MESFYYGDEGFEVLLKKNLVRCTFEVDVELSETTVQEVNRIVLEKRRGLEQGNETKEVVRERFLRYKLTLEALPGTGHSSSI
ncbi:MAG: hypothetical protein ONB05_03700 [candidate division KSB1 bacterium]|nr:hypothetical protein [candidate division KSB1 bacterium]